MLSSATASAERGQFNGPAFPATAWAEGGQFNGPPSSRVRTARRALERCHRAHTGSNGLFPRLEIKEVRSGAPHIHYVEFMTQTWIELLQTCAERTGHSKMDEFASNVNG